MSYASLLQELATSAEFEHSRRLDDAVAWAAAQRRAGERPRNLEAPPGVDERPVEIPWCLSRVRPGEAGCSTSATRSPSRPTSKASASSEV